MAGGEPKRQLTLLQSSAIIVGVVIGSGVFISLPLVATIAGSPGISILIWLLGGVVWIPQVLVLAEMGTAYPMQGGPYLYLSKAGSPFLAFFYTWTAFLTSDTPTLTIVSLSAVSALKVFSPVFADTLAAKVIASATILGFGALHTRSVQTGGNVQVVLTCAKMAPLLALILMGAFFLDSGNLFMGMEGHGVRDQGLTAMLMAGVSSTLWSYAGFTNILYMAGEVRMPERTLPLSLLGSLAFVTLSYTLIATSTMALVPFSEIVAAKGGFVNPFSYLPWMAGVAGVAFAIAAFVSMMGGLSACVMSQPRLEYAIAKDGVFFSVFGHLHPRFLTPDYSILIQCGLAILLFFLGNIEELLGYFTLSYALQNFLLYAAVFFLRRRSDYQPAYRAPLWAVMAAAAAVVQLAVMVGAFLAYPTGAILASLGLIVTGGPVYWYFWRGKKRALALGLTTEVKP